VFIVRHQLLRSTCHAILGLSLCVCTGKDEDTADPERGQRCTSEIRYRFPDTTDARFDGCNDVLVDATFEFDPDDAPEVRSFKIQFARENVPGDDCWMVVTAKGTCGPGRYNIGSDQGTVVEFKTNDCSGVPDDYEGSFIATSGTLSLDKIHGGSEAGNFTGQRLLTQFRGRVDAKSPEGIELTTTFDMAVYISGEDAEENSCLRED
jgi:hypothetical protein